MTGIPHADRFLLCRPRGGLNDTLCRIEQCWRFAERTRRHLVIDTSRSALHGAFDDFFAVDAPSIPVTPSPDAELMTRLNTLACRPAALAGRLDRYSVRPVRGMGFVESGTGCPTRFGSPEIRADDADFPEPLLVYEDAGGGTDSFDLLGRVRFADAVAVQLRAILAERGTHYAAVHVRNTDYRMDYRGLFARIRKRVGQTPLLVCSDDPEVVEYARRVFDGPILASTRRLVSSHPTGALHLPLSYGDDALRRQAAFEALGDLVLLANARKLYIGRVQGVVKSNVRRETGRIEHRSVPFGTLSGYSRLAAYLCAHKDRLDTMLGLPPDQCRPPDASAAVMLIGLRARVRLILAGGLARLRVIRRARSGGKA